MPAWIDHLIQAFVADTANIVVAFLVGGVCGALGAIRRARRPRKPK